MEIKLKLNGEWETVQVHPDETLATILREKLRMTGTKVSCGQGECGACTVLLDGKAVNACLVLAASVDGRAVATIEGLSNRTNLDPIQQAFIEHDASQCGFCTPGMIMSTKGLLTTKPEPSTEDIKKALAGNICRCTGYKQIIGAVKTAADIQAEKQH